MPDESELRDRMRDGDAGGALDAARIIRRARMRRLPKQAAVSVLGGLAVAAIVVPVAIGVGSQTMSASDSAAGSAAAPESQKGSAFADSSADEGTACSPPLWDGDAVPSGVELRAAPSGGEVTLTLVNDSTQTLRGRVAGGPTLLLSTGDLLAGWSAGATDPVTIDLAPGERLEVAVALEPVACGGGALPPGSYDLDVELPILTEDGSTIIATSPRTPVEVGATQ